MLNVQEFGEGFVIQKNTESGSGDHHMGWAPATKDGLHLPHVPYGIIEVNNGRLGQLSHVRLRREVDHEGERGIPSPGTSCIQGRTREPIHTSRGPTVRGLVVGQPPVAPAGTVPSMAPDGPDWGGGVGPTHSPDRLGFLEVLGCKGLPSSPQWAAGPLAIDDAMTQQDHTGSISVEVPAMVPPMHHGVAYERVHE